MTSIIRNYLNSVLDTIRSFRKSNSINSKSQIKVKEETVVDSNSNIFNQVVSIWNKYTSLLFLENSFIDWADQNQDIILFKLRAKNGLCLRFKININMFIQQNKECLESHILKTIAEEVVYYVSEIVERESSEFFFAYDMNLDTAEKVKKIHDDEKEILTFAQSIYLIATDVEYKNHIYNRSLVNHIPIIEQRQLLKSWRRTIKLCGLKDITTQDIWIKTLNGSKKLIRINFTAMRPNGLTRLECSVFLNDLVEKDYQKLISKKLLKSIFDFKSHSEIKNYDSLSAEEQQKLIDDARYFERIEKILKAY